jgi:glycosyltransferase involved in cell wall biosynthesis
MKIVQVVGAIEPELGGPSIGAVGLHSALVAEGAHVVLCSTDRGAPDEWLDDVRPASPLSRVRLGKLGRPRQFLASLELLRILWVETRGSSLVHVHGQYFAPHIYAYVCSRLRRIPLGVQVHGALEPYQRAQSKFRKGVYNAIVGTRLLRAASYVLFATDTEADRAADVVRTQQQLVCALGAYLEPVRDSDALSKFGEAFGDTDRGKRVLFLGRLAKKKRLDVLIEAWSLIHRETDARLIIAGPDGELTAGEVRDQCRKQGIQQSVAVLGPVYGQEKSALFAQCGTFVLPSENENYGIALFEAMLSGAHIVSTPEVGAAEHARRAGALVEVPAGDAAALAGALEEALTNTAATHASGRRAMEYARQNAGWNECAKAILGRVGGLD